MLVRLPKLEIGMDEVLRGGLNLNFIVALWFCFSLVHF